MSRPHEVELIHDQLIKNGLQNDPELKDRYIGLYEDYRIWSFKWLVNGIIEYLVVCGIITAIVYLTNTLDSMRTPLAFLIGACWTCVLWMIVCRNGNLRRYRERIEKLTEGGNGE